LILFSQNIPPFCNLGIILGVLPSWRLFFTKEDFMIAVIGATGNIGKVIVQELLKKGKKVRAIARNSQRLKELETMGAETSSGSVQDIDFLASALNNVSAVFTMSAPDVQTANLREYQKNIADTIGSALEKSNVSHIVNLSSVGAELEAGTGPIAGLHQQESRLNVLERGHILHLRPTFFMENFLYDIPVIQGMGIHGTAMRADLTMGIIATVDIGMVAADKLANLNFQGRSVRYLLGPRDYTMAEVSRILGKAIGKPDLPYVQFPYEDALQGMMQAGISEDVAKSYVEMSKALNEGIVKAEPRTVENTTPTTLEQFAERVFAPVFKGA
jgi:uncharacterized protein YbjT (DUF2867 family)